MVEYLADHRTAPPIVTEDPSGAEYFERIIDADEMAKRLTHMTGLKWVVTTVPADNTGELWRGLDPFREAWETNAEEAAEDDETSEFVRTAFGSSRMREGGRP